MKVYHGTRDRKAQACTVTVEYSGTTYSIPMDAELAIHPSSRGEQLVLDWRSDGGGSNDLRCRRLALALLHDVVGFDLALAYYREFTREVVVRLPFDEWMLTEDEVRTAFRRVAKNVAARRGKVLV